MSNIIINIHDRKHSRLTEALVGVKYNHSEFMHTEDAGVCFVIYID